MHEEHSLAAELAKPGGSSPSLPVAVPPRDYFATRFLIVYAALGAILVASLVVLIGFGLRPGFGKSAAWSSWKPRRGSLEVMTKEIADHVAPKYRLASGAQIAAVVPSAPTVTAGTESIAIAAVAVRSPHGVTDVHIVSPTTTAMYTLCGLGYHCSIATGTPSLTRGQLVHREGLETALYLFKYVRQLQSVLVFMPPARGATATTVLYYRKEDLARPLSRPLAKTLPLAVPPRSDDPDRLEANTIAALTYPHLYTSQLTQLQPGGALLVLTPVVIP